MEKDLGLESPSGRLGFPREFPFEFESPTFSSAFTSPGDSTETEDESSDDEEDFLAGLTRRLALSTQRLPTPIFSCDKSDKKRQVVSTSPQSTLSGLGSWSASGSESPNGPPSQVPSPPTTPFCNDDAWDVISAAAGEVARLKMGIIGEQCLNQPNPNPNLHFHRHAQTPQVPLPHLVKPPNAAFCSERLPLDYIHSNPSNQLWRNECYAKQPLYQNMAWHPKSSYYQSQLNFKPPGLQFQRRVSGAGCENGMYARPEPWSLSQQPPSMRNAFPVGSAMKRPCAGTGVFLPRRYANSSESRKKSGGGNGFLQSKVAHPKSLNFDQLDVLSQLHSRPSAPSAQAQFDCESLMARSDSLVRQGSGRQVGGCLNNERPLPQEWMY